MRTTIKDLEGMFWVKAGRADHADNVTKNHAHLHDHPEVMLCGAKRPWGQTDWHTSPESVTCKRCKAAMRKAGISLPHWEVTR